jgi:hypothetical protein
MSFKKQKNSKGSPIIVFKSFFKKVALVKKNLFIIFVQTVKEN